MLHTNSFSVSRAYIYYVILDFNIINLKLLIKGFTVVAPFREVLLGEI
jgi:hypothetical protein